MALRCRTIEEALAARDEVTELGISKEEFNSGIAKLAVCSKLKKISNWSGGIESIPDEIAQLPQLSELALTSNQLKSLPEALFSLPKLKTLNLNDNPLESLPEGILKLPKLTQLDVSDSHFTQVPEVIFSLKRLQKLVIGGHIHRYMKLGKPAEWGFATLDERLFQLTNLSSLDVSGNRMSNLPPGLGALKKLKSLDLSHNKFPTLPADVGQLSKLTTLKLHGTAISTLPTTLESLTVLRVLKLDGAPLTYVPAALLSLPALSAASKRALEHYAGASKPAFEEDWRTTIPAVVALLGEEACASFVAFLRREVSSCSHDADDFIAWADGEGAQSGASADTLYDTLAKNLPAGCACVIKAHIE